MRISPTRICSPRSSDRTCCGALRGLRLPPLHSIPSGGFQEISNIYPYPWACGKGVRLEFIMSVRTLPVSRPSL